MAVIAVIAQGMMGAGVGRRLHENGAEVRTLLSGRSAAERRAGAGRRHGGVGRRKGLAFRRRFSSVDLPPGEAEPLARRLAPALAALGRKPAYVDCNAVSPQTAIRIAAIIGPTGARFRRCRDYRRAAAAGLQPDDLRFGSNRGANRSAARLGDRLARHRWPGRRGVRP